MANTVLLKRSSVANSAPTSLAYGELALNYTDGNLYYQNAGNVITVIASNKFVTVTGNVNAGNVIASGIVSATNNLVVNSTGGEGGQIVMAWVGISNISGQANSTWNLDVDSSNNFRAFTQNATGVANVILDLNSTTKVASFSGNVSAPYFIGNGSQLTGITANANVGGANTYVQFNDNGALGGNVKLTFNKTTGVLSSTSIVFPDSGGNTVGFTAPATVTAPVTWKLPPSDGTVYGNVLATDTTGNLLWRGFSSTVFVYTRGNVQVPVDAINGYVNILGRTGNVYVSIT